MNFRSTTATSIAGHSMNRSPLRLAVVFIPLVLACFALCPTALAISPLPDGGYANGNTAEGTFALFSFTGVSPANGAQNTAIGFKALYNNTGGAKNTASGWLALYNNTIGYNNTATGYQTLLSNTATSPTTSGHDNTAGGAFALNRNTIGQYNTATVSTALQNNTQGNGNTATGVGALLKNTIGFSNTATGLDALLVNTTGSENTADGAEALEFNTAASNTAIGVSALGNNTSGNNNIAIGHSAGFNLTTGDDNIEIFDPGMAGEANTIRIGTQGTQTSTYIAGIFGTMVTGPLVAVDSSGHLGVSATSSARFKDEIKPMDKASEAILALKPVTFRYKKELDPKGIPQFGLVAEEVEKVNPAVITRDTDGKPYTVRYEAVNSMLLNEFLKEYQTVQRQEATIAQMRSVLAKQEVTAVQQQKQIETLAASLQKVSAQLEVSKPAPQTALNNQ